MYFLYAPIFNDKIAKLNKCTLDYHYDLFDKKFNDIKLLDHSFSQKEINKYFIKTTRSYETQLSNIKNYLNRKFSLNHNEKFYEIILGYWLIHLISKFYFFENLYNYLSKKEIIPIQIINKKKVAPLNTDTFLDLFVNSEDYQNYLFSFYLSLINAKTYKIDTDFTLNQKTKKKYRYLRKFKYYLFNFILKVIKPKTIFFNLNIKNRFDSILKKFFVAISSYFNLICYDYGFISEKCINSKSSLNSIDEIIHKDKLFTFLINNIPLNITKNISRNKNDIFAYVPKNLFTYNNHFTDDFSFFYSNFYERVNLFICQHGSQYGIQNNHILEYLERRISDNYFTYGWEDGGNTISLNKSFLNKSYFNKNAKNFNNLLFVTNNNPIFFLRFQSHQQPFNNTIDYQNIPIEFIRVSLFKEKILFRPYIGSGHKMFKNLTKIKNYFPNLKIDKSLNISKSILNSRIVVLDHFGTAYFESLIQNKPTFLILNKLSNNFRKKFNSIELKLIKNKMLFYSPALASKFINDSYNDINIFWSSENVQKTIKELINNYYNIDDKWFNSLKKRFL